MIPGTEEIQDGKQQKSLPSPKESNSLIKGTVLPYQCPDVILPEKRHPGTVSHSTFMDWKYH